MLSPVAVKSTTVAASQNNCSASPVGAAGAETLMVIYFLQVMPSVVTSTQYSVVSDGVTVIADVNGFDISYNLNVIDPELSPYPP